MDAAQKPSDKSDLVGKDFPYRGLGGTAGTMAELGFSAADLRAIGRENALAPLPRLSPA